MNLGFILPTPPGEYLVQNNEFCYNKVISNGPARGGGFVIFHINTRTDYYYDSVPAPLIYNNLIHHNEADTYGAGIVTKLVIESTTSGIKSVEIHSMSGQLMECFEFAGSSCQKDIGYLNKGIYLITIKTKDIIRSEKIIKF